MMWIRSWSSRLGIGRVYFKASLLFLILSCLLSDCFPLISASPSMVVINPQVRHTSTRRPTYKVQHHENSPYGLDNHIRQPHHRHKYHNNRNFRPEPTTTTHRPINHQIHHRTQHHPNQPTHLQFHVILSTTKAPFQPGFGMNIPIGIGNTLNRMNANNLGIAGVGGLPAPPSETEGELARVKRRGARGGGFGNQGRKGPRDRLDYRKGSAVSLPASSVMIFMLIIPSVIHFLL